MNMDLIFVIIIGTLTVLSVGVALIFRSRSKDTMGSSNGLNCFDLCLHETRVSGGCSTLCSYGWQ